MGAKARKASKKTMQKASSQFAHSDSKTACTDFLFYLSKKPLEGGPSRGLPETTPQQNNATVLYIGRSPRGFYEEEMEGKSKHFGFIEFENPQVAEVVADCMHNYLLFEHLLQVHLIPPEHVHPKLGFNYKYKPVDYVQIERKLQNKMRTLEGHKKLVEKIIKRDQKRQKRIDASGIDYECPEIVVSTQPAPKKMKFDED